MSSRAHRFSAAAGRLAPGAVIGLSLMLNVWGLDREGDSNPYYAEAIRAMARNGHNFFFVAADPGGFISLDKPPVAFGGPAVLVHLFGYSSWTMLLPSAVAGTAAVGVLYLTVRSVWGRPAGLLAALVLALTPLNVAVARDNTPESTLVLVSVLAAWAVTRAVRVQRVRWLMAAAVLVGVGFNTKMLAAYLVLPGLWAAYLVAARHSWGRRVLHLVAATALVLVVSGAWIVTVDSAAKDQRPYVGGSRNNTEWDLAFGFNGLGRVSGPSAPRSATSRAKAKPALNFSSFVTSPGVDRLFQARLADQVGWLVPLAAGGAVAGLVVVVRRRRLDERAASLVLWGGWAATVAVVFSDAKGLFHPYYLSLLSPGIAALVGIGAVAWSGRLGHERVLALVGVVATAATGATEVMILRRTDYAGGLRWVAAIGAGLAAVLGVIAAIRARHQPGKHSVAAADPLAKPGAGSAPVEERVAGHRGRGLAHDPRYHLALIATALAVAVLLVPPAVWAWNATFIPVNGFDPHIDVATPQVRASVALVGTSPPLPAALTNEPGLVRYLVARQGTSTWMVAVPSGFDAAELALATNRPVLGFGGSHGVDRALSRRELSDFIWLGKLRYVLLGSAFGRGGAGSDGTVTADLVARACPPVSPTKWGSTGLTRPSNSTVSLFDCRGRSSAISSVPNLPVANDVSVDGFLQKANALCKPGETRIAQAFGAMKTEPDALDRIVTEIVPIVRAEVAGLRRLTAPLAASDTVEGLTRDTDRLLDDLVSRPGAYLSPGPAQQSLLALSQRYKDAGLSHCFA